MDRALYLTRLEAERKQAEWVGESRREAELSAQIMRLSRGSTASPARETTARRTTATRRKR